MHIQLFEQWNADHCSWSCTRMSGTLTFRRFGDDCCTVVANPADNGVRVDGRGGGGVRVKMRGSVSKANNRDRGDITKERKCDSAKARGRVSGRKGSEKEGVDSEGKQECRIRRWKEGGGGVRRTDCWNERCADEQKMLRTARGIQRTGGLMRLRDFGNHRGKKRRCSQDRWIIGVWVWRKLTGRRLKVISGVKESNSTSEWKDMGWRPCGCTSCEDRWSA